MKKFQLIVRHRPSISESIEGRFHHFTTTLRELPQPWGLREEAELCLPPVGSGLSTLAKLRGKLGRGVSGSVEFMLRVPENLHDSAAHDDSMIIEFGSDVAPWNELVRVGVPGYLDAIDAYACRLERWDEMPKKFERWARACSDSGKDLDGRDGFLDFGPLNFMDHELCRRGCNGMSPEQIVQKLRGHVPSVELTRNGVLIVASEDFPEQLEILQTSRLIRDRLGLVSWT